MKVPPADLAHFLSKVVWRREALGSLPGLGPAGAVSLRQTNGPNIITFDVRRPCPPGHSHPGGGGRRSSDTSSTQTIRFTASADSRRDLYKQSMSRVPAPAPGRGRLPSASTSRGRSRDGHVDANAVSHSPPRNFLGWVTKFDVPGAGQGAGQGTFSANINEAGQIAGWYTDAAGVVHGFLRARDGWITHFDAPGAGTAAGQGTNTSLYGSLNPMGVITGNYIDAKNVSHATSARPEAGSRRSTLRSPARKPARGLSPKPSTRKGRS